MTIKRKPQIPRSLPDYEKAAKEFYGMNAKDLQQWIVSFMKYDHSKSGGKN